MGNPTIWIHLGILYDFIKIISGNLDLGNLKGRVALKQIQETRDGSE
jgi:hypothetical protein